MKILIEHSGGTTDKVFGKAYIKSKLIADFTLPDYIMLKTFENWLEVEIEKDFIMQNDRLILLWKIGEGK